MWAKRQQPPMWVDAELPHPDDVWAVWKIRFKYREPGDAARERDRKAADAASGAQNGDPG